MLKKLKRAFGRKKKAKGGSGSPSKRELQGGLGNAAVIDSMGQKQKAEGLGMGFTGSLLGKQLARTPARTEHPFLTDKDVSREKSGPSVASINQVHRMKYNDELGDSGSKIGYFKASSTNQTDLGAAQAGIKGHMASRAVASSRLDEELGTNVLSREYFAQHGGEVGSVSAQGRGTELARHLFEDRTSKAYMAEQEGFKSKDVGSERFAEGGFDAKDFGQDAKGRMASRSGLRFNQADVRNGEFQRGMANLAVMDYLTGQVDRHLQNVLVGENGQVTGIDNDQAFGTNREQYDNPELNSASKNVGMPTLLDAGIARNLLDMSEEKFLNTIGGSGMDPEELTGEEKDAALERFQNLRQLALEQDAAGETISDWGDESFERAMQSESGSYLANYARGVQGARWSDEVKGVTDDKESRKKRQAIWDEGRHLQEKGDFKDKVAWARKYQK